MLLSQTLSMVNVYVFPYLQPLIMYAHKRQSFYICGYMNLFVTNLAVDLPNV